MILLVNFQTAAAADLVVEVEYTPGTAGRTCGAPGDCYPAEDAEVEVVEATDEETGETVTWTPSRAEARALRKAATRAFEDAAF